MSKNKLTKFAEISAFPNVFQNTNVFPDEVLRNGAGEIIDYKGKWSKEHFKNDHPIILELACGRGEYAIGMARQNPKGNYIGVDVKGNRIWGGAQIALKDELTNVAFIRTRIESLTTFFAPEEISEIWITFADPFPTDRRKKRRLTFTRFLDMYKILLKADGLIHLKTDSDLLYEFTLEMIEENKATILYQNNDIYANGYEEPLLDIKTKYEMMHLADGRTIKYVKFRL